MKAVLWAIALAAYVASFAFAFRADGRWKQYGEPRQIGAAFAVCVIATAAAIFCP